MKQEPDAQPAADAPRPPAGTSGADAQQSESKALVASTSQPSQKGFGNVVYIVDMTWYTTDLEVEAACVPYGAIKNIKFFEDRSNGRSAGTCIVEFSSHEEAKSCIEGLNKQKIGDRTVTVTWPSKNRMPSMKGNRSASPQS